MSDFLSRFVEAQSLRDGHRHSLRVLIRDRPDAGRQGKAECCRSGQCCWRRPGELSADDVPRLAARLGLSPPELFARYLVVDDIRDHLSLLPRRAGQEGGRMLGWRETYDLDTPCVFLGESGDCSVHEDKPAACREFRCWEEAPVPATPLPWAPEALRALGWDGVSPDDWEATP